MYCDKCGAQLDDNAAFCTSCGAKIEIYENTVSENGENQNEFSEETTANTTKNYQIKKVIIGVVAGCAAALVCFGGFKLAMGIRKGEPNLAKLPLVYEKEDEVKLLRYGKTESFRIGNKDDDVTYRNELVQITDDGKQVFFAEDYGTNGEFKLYCRKTSQKVPKGRNVDSTGYRIASGVTSFAIASDGKFVVYQKDDSLYWTDMKKERTISRDVGIYHVSDDNKMIIYSKDGGMYTCRADYKSEPEKVDSDIGGLVSEYGEYKTIYYIKDEALYMKKYGKDKVKLSNDIYTAEIVDDVVYVAKKDEVKKDFDDLFYDDCAKSDAQLEEPEYEDFRKESDDSIFGYVTDYEAYYEARDAYEAKEERDEIREYYDENPQTVFSYSIYRINKSGEEEKIGDGFDNAYASNKVLIKNIFDDDSAKIKLSEIDSMSDAREKVSNLSKNIKNEKYVLKSDGKLINVTDKFEDNKAVLYASLDEKYLYSIEDKSDETQLGTLNRYTIGDSSIGKKTKLLDDVKRIERYEDFILVEREDEVGIYSGSKYYRIAEDISNRTFKDGALYFFDNYDYDKRRGDFYVYKDGKTTRIDTDVFDISVRSSNYVYYIKDYSTTRRCGDLYINKGGKAKRLDTDVRNIIF